MRSGRGVPLARLVVLLPLLLVGGIEGAQAQFVWKELVFTSGFSIERYRGNLTTVTVPLVDSTNRAWAPVGELGVRGEASMLENRNLTVRLDAGLRQFAAMGFRVRDYAPREWVGSLDADYWHWISNRWRIDAGGRVKGRRVQDRPPMPLYIHPGYDEATGVAGIRFWPRTGFHLSAQLSGVTTNYKVSQHIGPQLDLLDRRGAGMELSAQWAYGWTLRFFGSYSGLSYPRQGSFDAGDPFRRDRAVRAGLEWRAEDAWASGRAHVRIEGILNRSNSERPEYDAFKLSMTLSTFIPWDFLLQFSAVVTGKSYLHSTEFARLVPGEEADNASVVHLEFSRSLASNLDGALRFVGTRAEAEVGESYFRRYGVSVMLQYRPFRW